MELVIKIDYDDYQFIKDSEFENYAVAQRLYRAVYEGTPLPKGHGRLIDADDVNNHILGAVDLRDCPTIIEADK